MMIRSKWKYVATTSIAVVAVFAMTFCSRPSDPSVAFDRILDVFFDLSLDEIRYVRFLEMYESIPEAQRLKFSRQYVNRMLEEPDGERFIRYFQSSGRIRLNHQELLPEYRLVVSRLNDAMKERRSTTTFHIVETDEGWYVGRTITSGDFVD